MGNIITITESAQTFIKAIFAANPNTALVVGHNSSGCSGYKYTFALCDNADIDHNYAFVQIPESGKVVIHPHSVFVLNNAVLDLHVENFGEQLVWHNPNIIDTCGCGDSFKLPNEEDCV
jgi:iron-sulfur cluster assembly accessory protein